MGGFKNVLGLFFFGTLMLIKVSAFHIYTHDDTDADNIENCIVCDAVLENLTSDIQFAGDNIDVVPAHEIADSVPQAFFDQPAETAVFYFRLFSRPPPVSLV